MLNKGKIKEFLTNCHKKLWQIENYESD